MNAGIQKCRMAVLLVVAVATLRGDEALDLRLLDFTVIAVDDHGQPVRVPGGGRGAVLYRGPTSVCGVATTAEWGFGFRAFPFAGLIPRRFCVRIYAGGALEATMRMGQLWRGAHPLVKMHTWLLTGCKATFSRPVPFQIGGDRMGMRSEIEYGLASQQVDVLDWRRVG